MLAAVCNTFGNPLDIEDLVMDPPQQGEVKIRLAATAICHSDVHFIRGEWIGKTPVVAGHEAAGYVEEIGPGVTGVKPGDPVITTLLRSCGGCFFCATGSPNLCAFDFPLNTQSRLKKANGDTVWHGVRTAAFAEYTIVDQTQVARIPDTLPMDQASLLACGVITGLGAVVNTASVKPGESVVVIGVGGVGLNSIQGAAISGANPIVAVDVVEDKLEAAKGFGATHTLNAGEDVKEGVLSITSGQGADFVFVTVGSSEAVEQGFELLRRGGTEVIVGIPSEGTTMTIPLTPFAGSERRIVGSFMGSTRLSVDIPRLVGLYERGELKLAELISGRYPLDRINEAIESMEGGGALRNVVLF